MSELPGMTYQESKVLTEVLIAEAVSKGTYIFTAVQNERKDYKISKRRVARSYEVILDQLLVNHLVGIVPTKETKNGRGSIPPKPVVQRARENGGTPGSNGPRKVR